MGPSARQIWIVGRYRFQNELLCLYLEEKLECHCRFVPLDALNGGEFRLIPLPSMLLVDCSELRPEVLLRLLLVETGPLAGNALKALINVCAEVDIEREAMASGARGFFYVNDPGEVLIKGIKALFDGELWLSRRKMERILLHGGTASAQNAVPSLLTPREEEILSLLSSGISNNLIADRLCISPHTVRTHIYKIFQKIEVPNRFQAALWAAQNL